MKKILTTIEFYLLVLIFFAGIFSIGLFCGYYFGITHRSIATDNLRDIFEIKNNINANEIKIEKDYQELKTEINGRIESISEFLDDNFWTYEK